MTTKLLKGQMVVLLAVAAFALIGITFAYASEVTGTLSSNASSNTQNTGSIAGSVSSGGTGGGGGGGSNNGSTVSGGMSSNPTPQGAVLGASTGGVGAPSFPNAGFAPQ